MLPSALGLTIPEGELQCGRECSQLAAGEADPREHMGEVPTGSGKVRVHRCDSRGPWQLGKGDNLLVKQAGLRGAALCALNVSEPLSQWAETVQVHTREHLLLPLGSKCFPHIILLFSYFFFHIIRVKESCDSSVTMGTNVQPLLLYEFYPDCFSLLQGIFPTPGLNPGLPHCRQILYQLSHKGSPGMGKQWKQ